MKTKVVNIHHEDYEVYIGRTGYHDLGLGGYFGNPFKVDAKTTREKAVKLYRTWFYDRIKKDKEFRRHVKKLRGKVLGCFCKPKLCHGDIIVEYLHNGLNHL